jgi:signal transduction histidine kinase
LKSSIDREDLRLRADESLVTKIVLNLLSNAVKFTPANGRVDVDVRADARSGVAISVADSGIGIAPSQISKALEPFSQLDERLERRYEGIGLGLSLAKHYVEMHGGTIEIDSRPAAGTTVTANFPPDRVIFADPTAFEAAVPKASAG